MTGLRPQTHPVSPRGDQAPEPGGLGGKVLAVEALSDVEVGFLDSRNGRCGAWKAFKFDRVWGPEATQEDVFLDVEALALSVLEGENACILAYGQTGSGKTYTMGGNKGRGEVTAELGITYRLLVKLMELVGRHKGEDGAEEALGLGGEGEGQMQGERVDARTEDGKDRKHGENAGGKSTLLGYDVSISMVEVYNDEVRDLLPHSAATSSITSTTSSSSFPSITRPASASTLPVLEIRQDADHAVRLPGMVEATVESVEGALSLIAHGDRARSTGATNVHEHSSRSHSIILLTVISRSTGEKGRLYLVDLAGSERVKKSGVTGTALKEAQHINKSLSALGDVMVALDKKAQHVPYRNSSLTHLLQDCLGGSARTLMIVTVSPMGETAEETHCTLQFATRVRDIQLAPDGGSRGGRTNVRVKNLERELQVLRGKLKAKETGKIEAEDALSASRKELALLQREVKSLAEAKGRGQEERRRGWEDQLNAWRSSNEALTTRWHTEKTAREKLAQDLDEAQKMIKRLQQHTETRGVALTGTRQQLRDKEEEVKELKKNLRSVRRELSAAMTASSLPRGSAISAVQGPSRSTRTMNGPHQIAPLVSGGRRLLEESGECLGDNQVHDAGSDADLHNTGTHASPALPHPSSSSKATSPTLLDEPSAFDPSAPIAEEEKVEGKEDNPCKLLFPPEQGRPSAPRRPSDGDENHRETSGGADEEDYLSDSGATGFMTAVSDLSKSGGGWPFSQRKGHGDSHATKTDGSRAWPRHVTTAFIHTPTPIFLSSFSSSSPSTFPTTGINASDRALSSPPSSFPALAADSSMPSRSLAHDLHDHGKARQAKEATAMTTHGPLAHSLASSKCYSSEDADPPSPPPSTSTAPATIFAQHLALSFPRPPSRLLSPPMPSSDGNPPDDSEEQGPKSSPSMACHLNPDGGTSHHVSDVQRGMPSVEWHRSRIPSHQVRKPEVIKPGMTLKPARGVSGVGKGRGKAIRIPRLAPPHRVGKTRTAVAGNGVQVGDEEDVSGEGVKEGRMKGGRETGNGARAAWRERKRGDARLHARRIDRAGFKDFPTASTRPQENPSKEAIRAREELREHDLSVHMHMPPREKVKSRTTRWR
jgi:kinesin family protein C2/C3